MADIRPSQITYGPALIVTAWPIEPVRCTTSKLTEEQRAEMARRNANHNEHVETTIREVYAFTEAKAQFLSETCGHKPDYYLRLIFSGGASLQKARKPNTYNAWSHQLAKDKNADAEPGEASNLLSLQQEYRDEYDKLTPEQKRDLCALLEEERDSQSFGIRVNQKGRVQDVVNTFRHIITMLLGLKCRCGVEAFIGLVRNNTEYELRPQWFFTSPSINRYLTGSIKRWDVEVIGSQMEAFSIAGCELFMFLRTNRDQADWLKNEIREKVNSLLVEVTGRKSIRMEYQNYEKKIVVDLGYEIVGWTHEVFACPSALPTAIDSLKKLRDALETGECYFRRLSQSERVQRRCAYEEQVKAGAVKLRKERSDKGKKHKAYQRKSDSGEQSRHPNKRRRTEHSESESESSESPDEDE